MKEKTKLPISVLIVDDEPVIVEQLAQILMRRVATVHTARNGSEAWECYTAQPLDLIISDIDMPVMNGIELLKSVRANDRHIPFILSTGLKNLDVLIQAIEHGITSFLPKPLQKQDLIAKIEEIAHTKELELSVAKNKFLLEQYKTIVDSSSIVSKTDEKGIITFVNDMFCSISGYSREELLGQPHNMVRDPKMPSHVFKDMWATIQAKEIWHGYINNRTKEGTRYTVKTTIAPILDQEGNIVEYIGLREDVTELQRAKDEAKAAAKMKGDFLANMSHEIRTPMNGIIGFTELLSKSELNEKQKRYIDIISSSTQALMGIVNDILDFSKIESGKVELEYTAVNPFVEFTAMAQLFTAGMEGKQISFDTAIDPNLAPCLRMDTLRMGQIIANLLSNAVKFTPEKGHIAFYADLLGRTEEGMAIRIGIKDTGIGIPLSQRKKIFEAFSQADTSITRNFGGTGLGLSISSHLVFLMGGILKVESEEGKGSHFYFEVTLPVCDETFASASSSGSTIKPHLVGRVLVAEDNRVNQMLIEEYLNKFNLDAVMVENGQEVLDQLDHHPFDLIFMDVNMPVMDGIKATAIIKKRGFTVPIVALTANAMNGDREKLLKKGFDNYLAKPIVVDQLEKILETYIAPTELSPVLFETKLPCELETDALIVLDIEVMRKELALPDKVIRKLLSLFLRTSIPYVTELKSVTDEMNLQKIEDIAHKIKGTAANLRLKPLEEVASQIETAARLKKEMDYQELCSRLEMIMQTAQGEITEFLNHQEENG